MNVSITESQITDLVHTTDTNASTECADNEYLDGSGDCINLNATIDDRVTGITNNSVGITLNFSHIFSDDWSNVTLTESQVTDLVHTTDTNASTECSNADVLLDKI